MKRTIVCMISLLFLCGGVHASTLLDQFNALESSHDFGEKTLYTFIEDDQLLEGAQRFCNEESILQGTALAKKLTELINERYATMSDAEMLIDSLDLRNRIHAMHGRLDGMMSETSICMRKIMMYTLQKELRRWHITLIDEQGLIADFNENDPPLRAFALKNQIFETVLHAPVVPRTPTIAYVIKNPSFLDHLSDEQKVLAQSSRDVMERAIRDVLIFFLNKGRFTPTDIERIHDKFVFEWVSSCTIVGGKYEVQYEVGKGGVREKTQTTKINLTVSTCTKIGFILQNYRLSRLIVMHELGHHIRWYKDPDVSKFTDLCRSAEGERTSRCVLRDFVSEYAETAPEEDYAESFQQRIIKRRDRPGFIDDKLEYFEELFQ